MTDLLELGRRAVACKHWRWIPGMRMEVGTESGSALLRVLDVDPDSGPLVFAEGDAIGIAPKGAFWLRDLQSDHSDLCGPVPDLSDPATLGCLLALVREALPGAWVLPDGDQWHAFRANMTWVSSGATEAEALVAALEAAP